jgi:glycosyltransferase involved in cell wall biosynthesis
MSRVLLHSLVFAPDSVSTAQIMTELAIELKNHGHVVTVLTTMPYYNVVADAVAKQPMTRHAGGLWYTSQIEGIRVWHVRIPAKGKRLWQRALEFARFHLLSLIVGAHAVGRQDVVISTSPPLSIGAVSWMLAARWGAQSVYKVAELFPDLAIRQGAVRGSFMIGIMRSMERFVYARNAMIVAIAEQFSELIRQRGVPERKVRTIPDCVDTEFYRPLPRTNRFAEEHGLVDEFVVLYGGNIGLVHDWESVLFAAEKLVGVPIQFVIVGDGARRDWLLREVAARGLENVRLLGYQPRDRMPEINAACDIGMIPLTHMAAKDAFPSKVYSNLACSRPVIVSAAPGSDMARLVESAGCGRAVRPEDKQAFLTAVLDAYRERETLPLEGRRGRELVERKFSKQSMGAQYDSIIRELTQPNPLPA